MKDIIIQMTVQQISVTVRAVVALCDAALLRSMHMIMLWSPRLAFSRVRLRLNELTDWAVQCLCSMSLRQVPYWHCKLVWCGR